VTTGPVDTAPEARVIDLAGQTLMPGMFTGHVHIDTGPSEPYHYNNIYSRAERPPGVLMARAIRNCKALLDSGITSYVGAGCSFDIDEQLRIAIKDGLLDGPRITAGGRRLNTTGHSEDSAKWWYQMHYHPFDRFVDGPAEFRKAARKEIQRGVDIVKIAATSGHGTVDRGRGITHKELLAVVEAAHDRGKKVRAHCVWRDSIIECIEAGVDVIDHGDETDERCIELMAENGTTWIPSMKFLTFLRMLPPDVMPEMPRGDLDHDWDHYCRMLPLANDAGVNIVPGDDYGGGPMPHRPGIYGEELSIYANDVGVKPLDVLRWATYNGAQLSGHKVGEIREGLLADLVVVDGDPSTDITILENADNIKAVIIDGRFVKDEMASSGRDQDGVRT
jgi:imidazolonepropionase-like amidohydrolase